jgi:multidrug efflux pump subunit AcrB
MWIVKAALKNPYAVAVLAFMIMVLGLVAIVNIPKDILPVFKAPAVQVMTYYSGMPTSAVEKTITNRIERWTNQATGCQRVESKSMLGVSVVRLYFRDDIDPNGALTQANSLALGTLPTLPPNTLPPVVLPFDPTGTLPLSILSVTSPELGETQLKDLARIDVRNMLGGVPGVVAPAVFGGKDRTILVYVNPRKLETRNLSPLDVVKALQNANIMVTPGVAKFGSYEFQLDSNAMVNKVQELNDIPIRLEPGNNVYLRDIGHAEDSHAIQTALVRIDGRRQVYVPIYRQQGASSLTVVDGVRAASGHMMDVLKAAGHNVNLKVVMDQSVYVREAIKSLIHEGVIGALLVSAMILIFLGNARMTLIASMSIPLAVLSAIIGLYATGNTINAMTLGGLALAIGPLVDDAIVVLENTHRHHSLGKSKIKAAFDGAVEVTVPVLVATLTTIIVLCPIALMPGMGGFLFRPLTLAVAFAMLSSFVLSRTFVPVLCARWLGEHTHPGQEHAARGWGSRIHRRIEVVLNFLTHCYERLLALALRHRVLVLTLVGLLFVGSFGLYFKIGQEFFPQVDAGQITLFVRCPAGTNIEASEKLIAQVEDFLKANIPARERQMVISEMGLVPDWSAAYTPNSATWDANVKVQLADERTKSAQEYAILLRHAFRQKQLSDPAFADLRVSFDTGGMVSAALNYGASSPIDVQVEGGKTLEDAQGLAQNVQEHIMQVRGAADVHIQQRLDAPQRIIVVDRQQAADVGLSEKEVIDQVATAMNSSVAINRNFWIDPKSGNQYFVAVQYAEDPDMNLEDVLNVVATGTNQPTPVKLSSLVHIESGTAAVEVNHVNLARVFDVLVNTENRDIGGVAADIHKQLLTLQQQAWARPGAADKGLRPPLVDPSTKALNFPAGIRVSLKGEYARMTQSFSSLGWGLGMAVLLVYLLLVGLFRSWLGPFIIIITVPLGMIGVFTMLFLTHTTANVQSEMGAIFLVGIVVSNGVLLVDFGNRQRKLGASVRQAISTAAAIRFRPIIMTFLATFLDLVPMAIGMGRGSEANVPLARAVVGGLLTSTFLTLLVVPILYTLLNRDTGVPEIDIDKELAEPEKPISDMAVLRSDELPPHAPEPLPAYPDGADNSERATGPPGH